MANYMIVMKNGKKHSGKSIKEKGMFVIIKNGREEIRVLASDIEKIEGKGKLPIKMMAGLTIFAFTGFWL